MKRGTPPHTRYGTSELKDAWMEIRTLKRGGELNQIYELSSTELTAMSIIFKPNFLHIAMRKFDSTYM